MIDWPYTYVMAIRGVELTIGFIGINDEDIDFEVLDPADFEPSRLDTFAIVDALWKEGRRLKELDYG